jgi:hypothetical protein
MIVASASVVGAVFSAVGLWVALRVRRTRRSGRSSWSFHVEIAREDGPVVRPLPDRESK